MQKSKKPRENKKKQIKPKKQYSRSLEMGSTGKSSGILVLLVLLFFWFSRGFFDFCIFYFYKSSGILVLLVLLVFLVFSRFLWFLHFFTFTRVLEYWFYWLYSFFWFSRGFFDFCIFYICKTSIILFVLRTNNAYFYICIYDTPFAHEKGRLLGGVPYIYIYLLYIYIYMGPHIYLSTIYIYIHRFWFYQQLLVDRFLF